MMGLGLLNEMHPRLRIIAVLGLILALVLGIKLFIIQVVDYPKYSEYSANNRIRIIRTMPLRGNIYDRNGKLLADNRPSYNVCLVEEDIKDKDKTMYFLEQTLGLGKDYVQKKLKEYRWRPYTPVVVKRDISEKEVAQIEENRLDLPGVVVERVPARNYVYGSVGSSLLGYVGRISRDDYEKNKDRGYSADDMVGITGLEKEYEDYLRGEKGGMQVQVDSRGYRDRILKSHPPARGYDIYTTIDIDLQKDVENIMDGAKGAAVVLNAQSGEVLALASKPDFDPNIFSGFVEQKEIDLIIKNKDLPLLNRAISGMYPPGSIFKVVIALASLDRPDFSVNTKHHCSGSFSFGDRVFNCWEKRGHGYVDLRDAIKYSCNIYFYNEGLNCGVSRIIEAAGSYGYGQETGIDIYGEVSPELPGPEWKKEKTGQSWYQGDTVNLSIGQGYMLATPLQSAVFLSAVANGGSVYRPRVALSVVRHDTGDRIKEFLPFEKSARPINEKKQKIIKDSMWRVVNEAHGTGTAASVPGFDICGKTGTAQAGNGTHAWFGGFAPRANPEVVVVVLIEGGESGSHSAAPLAGRIFKSYCERYSKK
ncbi:MAG: penicillin-binding protein 2 [Candidatus Aureabacteria bacterium]|nr:penicillin-binding protein 2 [Candidatus Auribacterota bacterium]